MPELAFTDARKEERRLRVGIMRSDEELERAANEFWNIMKAALRNPKSEKDVDRFDARITGMLVNTEEKRILGLLEKALKEGAVEDVRKAEGDAFSAYASVGMPEERLNALLELRRDVEKGADSLSVLDANAERMGEQQFAKIIELSEKSEVRREEIVAVLGKAAKPELADALYALLQKEEAASVAARNALGLGRDDYERIFGIAAKNEIMAVLRLYQRVLGDASFAKARDALMRGDKSGAMAEVSRMGIAAQYLFFAMLAPAFMRNGMWNRAAARIAAKALGKIAEIAGKLGLDAGAVQADYLLSAKKFTSRFGDAGALNFALFSSAYALRLGKK